MSALLPKADISGRQKHVRFEPFADISCPAKIERAALVPAARLVGRDAVNASGRHHSLELRCCDLFGRVVH
jgi:hypothetical protein